jgi:type IV secretion system protein TrbI
MALSPESTEPTEPTVRSEPAKAAEPAAPAGTGGNPFAPRPLPAVQRLSRAVLVAAAGLVTVTLLAVAFLATPRPLPHAAPLSRPPATGDPGFLQRPPGNLPAARPELTEQEFLRRLLARGPQAGGGAGGAGGAGARPWGAAGGPGANGAGGGTGAEGAYGAGGYGASDPFAGPDGAGLAGGRQASGSAPLNLNPPPAPPRDLRREAFLRALNAPLTQAVPAAPGRSGAAGPAWPPLPSPEALGLEDPGLGGGAGLGGDAGAGAETPGPEEAASEGAGAAPPLAAHGGYVPGRSPLAAPPLAPVRPGGAGGPLYAKGGPGGAAAAGSQGWATPSGAAAAGTQGWAAPNGAAAAGTQGWATPTGAAAAGAPGWAAAAPAAAGGSGFGVDGRRAEGAGAGAGSRGGAAGPAGVEGGAGGGAFAAFRAGEGLSSRVPEKNLILPAGTVVPALLLTAVNSDLPGPLMAQVSRDVYDLAQRRVVLARGARLLGRYENQVAVGQRRLLVAWTRLQLLDGTLVELPGLPGADRGGAAGLPARVENHLLRVFGDAVLLSLLSVGADLSQPPSRSLVVTPSAGSVAGAAVGQQLADAGTQLLRRDLSIQPTLRLPAGTPLTVFVNGDLAIPGGGAGAGGAEGGGWPAPGGRP